MANQTVYPFGTVGSLPSSIGLVNDLKTGGADKALTAEQGKTIGTQIISEIHHDYDEMTPFSTGIEYKADSSQVGKALSSVTTYSESGWKNYRIPVSGASQITFRVFLSNYDFGCLFLDADDKVVEGVVSPGSYPDAMRTVGVPSGAVSFIWSIKESYFDDDSQKIVTVDYWTIEKIKSDIETQSSRTDYLSNTVGEIVIPNALSANYEHYKDGYQLKANDAQIGKTLDNVDTSSSPGFVNLVIPISGYGRIEFTEYSTGASYLYGSLILDSSNVVLSGVTSVGGDSRMSINLPNNAAYLILSINTPWEYDRSVVFYVKGSILDKLSSVSEGETSAVATGKTLKLTAGKPNSSGAMENGNYLTTETIFGEFYLDLADGWVVEEAHAYDTNGKMVSYQIVTSALNGVWSLWGALPGIVRFSTENMVPDYGYKIVIRKSDSGAIAEGENPITNFVHLSDSGLHRWIPDDLPNYDVALRRIDYIQHLRWTPLAKVPNSYAASGTDYGNIYFDKAGQLAIGVPYSDVAETRKYVPNYVSLRTFMTAVKNRRSLLYTEELSNNTSKYGITYKSGHRRAYYGTVCCGFTNWVMGSDVMYLSGAYGENAIPGLSTVANATANTVRPLDFVWSDGHISIITDILKDEFNNVRFIVWGEMAAPYPHRTIYTPEEFEARLLTSGGYVVHRWDGWGGLQEPSESEYSQYLLGQTRKEPEWGGDIMCFAGDYAAFAEGETIHLNARRNSVYTGVELYKNDVLLQTIDITELSADTIVTPNDEDWVDVNLTTLNLAYGKYKARLTDGTNTTDYTYFEIIGITMSATKSGNTVTIAFGSSNGTPVSVEQVRNNGFPNTTNGKYHAITEEEVTAGTMTLNWAYNSTYKYLLMLVRGDYGTVAKRILHPSA